MYLSEIKDTDSLTSHLLGQLLKKHVVRMWVPLNGRQQEVEISDFDEAPNDGLITLHYGITSDRTGDIYKWCFERIPADKIELVKDKNGDWWLYEID